MLALIGEGGQKEIVMPLSQYEAQRARPVENRPSQSSQIPQQVIPVTINLTVYEEADYEKAKDKVLEGISEAYARQRGT
jgi:hypothetical protein